MKQPGGICVCAHSPNAIMATFAYKTTVVKNPMTSDVQSFRDQTTFHLQTCQNRRYLHFCFRLASHQSDTYAHISSVPTPSFPVDTPLPLEILRAWCPCRPRGERKPHALSLKRGRRLTLHSHIYELLNQRCVSE